MLSASVKAMRKQAFNRIPYPLFVVGILNSLLFLLEDQSYLIEAVLLQEDIGAPRGNPTPFSSQVGGKKK
jgi:5-methylcytosine-specific restriction endonuclease McrBC GTP-binding regulatory subunit McrB